MGGRGFFDSHISHFHNNKTTQKSQLFYKTPTKPLHQNSSATAEDCYNPKQNPLNLCISITAAANTTTLRKCWGLRAEKKRSRRKGLRTSRNSK